jgi:hypothetical protein
MGKLQTDGLSRSVSNLAEALAEIDGYIRARGNKGYYPAETIAELPVYGLTCNDLEAINKILLDAHEVNHLKSEHVCSACISKIRDLAEEYPEFFAKEILKAWTENAYINLNKLDSDPHLISASIALLKDHLNVLPKNHRKNTFNKISGLLGTSLQANSSSISFFNKYSEDLPKKLEPEIFNQASRVLGKSPQESGAAINLFKKCWKTVQAELKPEIFDKAFEILVDPTSSYDEICACLGFFDKCLEDVSATRQLDIFNEAYAVVMSPMDIASSINLFKNNWKYVPENQKLSIWEQCLAIHDDGKGSYPTYKFTAACSLLKKVPDPTPAGSTTKVRPPKSSASVTPTSYGATACVSLGLPKQGSRWPVLLKQSPRDTSTTEQLVDQVQAQR